MSKNIYRAGAFLALGLTAVGNVHATIVNLTPISSAYTQDFDTLGHSTTTHSNLPQGWALSEAGGGTRDNEQYAADTGSSTTGDIYSYGISGSTERAFGGLRSGTLVPIFGVAFANNTGATITALDIAFTGEQWRLGAAGRTDRLAFQYSTDANSLISGTYLDFNALDFVTPNTLGTGAKDGNALENSTRLSATLTGLEITDGSAFWLRWSDQDVTGSDDGLAIDNFSLTTQSAAQSVAEPASLALAAAGMALLGLPHRRRRERN